MTTALITHPDCLNHVNPPGAPEQVARLTYVLRALEDLDLLRLEAPKANDAQIARVHDAGYIASIPGKIPSQGHNWLDGDTYLSPGSLDAIYRSAGGAVQAVDTVMAGEADNAFVATRPPGHHAEQATPMGFCTFGNIAIAAKHALDVHGLTRVAVLDFDVHHGNGTQALLQDDPRVFFVSSHQSPLWPGSGMRNETGPHGTIMNMPLEPGSGREVMMRKWDTALKRVAEHKPEMILISAGFDAHQDDPLANLRWTSADFADLTRNILTLAQNLCQGRVVSVLEGGYDLDALARATRAHIEELMKATA
ncbi:MAG: histone deacetylase family protein [Paracoccaceae bacterium]